MGTEPRRLLMLGAVAATLCGVVYWRWTEMFAGPVTPPRATMSGVKAASGDHRPPPGAAPDVHLDVLEGARPMPGATGRNLFRFKPKPPAPAPVRAGAPAQNRPVVSAPTGVPPPAPPPPIPLKFIGVVQAPQTSARIAALVDATGHPYHGAEGDVVAGQYRVLKIGPESIEMAYLDGRGRQTIRLSGS